MRAPLISAAIAGAMWLGATRANSQPNAPPARTKIIGICTGCLTTVIITPSFGSIPIETVPRRALRRIWYGNSVVPP